MKNNIIALSESILEDDPPKAVRMCLQDLTRTLQEESDSSVQKDKCMGIIEDVVNNDNIDPYIRTQLLDVVALIEQL